MVEIANKHGKCSFTIDVIVIDKPSAPENLKVTDVTDRSVSLTWDEPHSDGGANVFGYVIEKKEGLCLPSIINGFRLNVSSIHVILFYFSVFKIYILIFKNKNRFSAISFQNSIQISIQNYFSLN